MQDPHWPPSQVVDRGLAKRIDANTLNYKGKLNEEGSSCADGEAGNVENGGQDAEQNHCPRILIFCEQTVLVQPVANLLQSHTKYKVGTVAGVGAMSAPQRKLNLDSFRNGSKPVLVCTAAVEEGLDVHHHGRCYNAVRAGVVLLAPCHVGYGGRSP